LLSYFETSPTIYKVGDVHLKKYVNQSGNELWYGLVDQKHSALIGILKLEKFESYWQVRLTQIEEKHKSQGYGSFMYDYAVMNDGLTLISDTSQTEGDRGGSKGLWEKLYRQGRFIVCGYNIDTDEIIPLENSSEISSKIYNQKEDIVWMAMPKNNQKSIAESLRYANSKNKHRNIEWYGENILDN